MPGTQWELPTQQSVWSLVLVVMFSHPVMSNSFVTPPLMFCSLPGSSVHGNPQTRIV